MIIPKLSHAEFFLDKMESCGYNLFEFCCYFSAFVNSTRSFTWGVKKHLSGHPEFDDFWKKLLKDELDNPIGNKFIEIRNFIEKESDNKIVSGSMYEVDGKKVVEYFFEDNRDKDVLSQCKEYYSMILKVKESLVKKFDLDNPSSPYYWKNPEVL